MYKYNDRKVLLPNFKAIGLTQAETYTFKVEKLGECIRISFANPVTMCTEVCFSQIQSIQLCIIYLGTRSVMSPKGKVINQPSNNACKFKYVVKFSGIVRSKPIRACALPSTFQALPLPIIKSRVIL